MAGKRKTYHELEAEIERLVAQKEGMKDDKLNVLLDTFKREFSKNKTFQNQLIKTDDAILKEMVFFLICNYENYANNIKNILEEKNQKNNKDTRTKIQF